MWSNKYLGIPYLAHGRDLSGIDCWGLVRLIYKSEYNIDLPSLSESYLENDRARSEELISQYREGWEPVDTPVEGCVVVLRVMGHLSHVGVCVNQHQFIHAQEGVGTSIQDLDGTKWKNRVHGFYRYRENSDIVLNAIPHPLKTERVTTTLVPGTTIEQLYSKITTEYNIPQQLNKNVHIFVNGVLIPRVVWNTTTLQATDVVEYRAVPDKDVVRVAAFIALAIAAPQIAATIGPGLGTAIGVSTVTATYIAQAAVLLAGSALINAVLPIRPPTQSDPGSSEAQLMVSGGQNQATPYGAIPVVLGKVRLTPPLAMNSFVTFDNVAGKSISFLNTVLAWGYGQLSIDESSFRIGSTDLTEYDDVVQKTIDYYPTTPANTDQIVLDFNNIAAGDVVQNYSGLELVQNYKSVASGVTQAEWNSTYGGDNNGTYFMRQKNFSGNYADTTYRSVWSNYSETVLKRESIDIETYETNEITESEIYTLGEWTESTFNQQLDKVVLAVSFPQGLRKIKVKTGKTENTTVSFDVQFRYRNSTNTAWETWPITSTVITVTRNEKDGFTYTSQFNLDNTKLGVQFRIRRTTDTNSEPNDDDRLNHVSVLHSFTGYYSDPAYRPHSWAPGRPTNTLVAKTAFKIRATDQLNGSVQGISAIVQSVCKIWNGTNWNTVAPTSNPAALFLHVLTHPANPQRVEVSELSNKIDLTKIQYWYNYCENYQVKTYGGPVSKKLEYNGVLGAQRSVLEVLRDICAAGRGSPALKDGKWTVTIDEPQSVVVQHFTPHNSWGFESVKALPRYPDAFKIQFYNEEKNYQQDEVLIISDGYTKDTAELFEIINIPGVTNSVLAEDFGRWHYAQIKLRPEIFTLNTDIEYLVCNRGDRVKVLHDVPMWGLQSGRVKNRLSSDIFELDEELPITENLNYTIRFRGVSNTGTGTTQVLNTERQIKTTFNLTTYSVSGGNVTLNIGAHPLKVNDRVAVIVAGVSNISLSTAVINLVTDTTIRYSVTGAPPVATTTATGTVKLKDGYYTKIQTTATTTQYEAADGDLFMFGKLQQESQDLLVIAIEPTNGAKNARITLVDYGVQSAIAEVTPGYDIFNNYYDYTGLSYFSNISNTPVLQIDDIGTKKPEILSERVVSDESVMTKIGENTFIFAIRVPFVQDLELPATVTHVQGQIGQDSNSETYKFSSTEVDKSSITFNEVEEGKTYKIRLRYVDSSGRVGLWTDWVTHTVLGKFSPPPNVAGFSYAAQPGGIKFNWNRPDVVDYKNTIIKNITGATWDTGTVLFQGDVTTWTWTNASSQNYVIAARHLDTSGILSSSNAVLNIDYLAVELAAVRVELDNDTHNIPAKADGTSPVLTLSGTDIEVYQGGSLLKYDAVGTAAGRWRIVSVVGTNCTPGTVGSVVNAVSGDDKAVLADLQAFSTTQDTGQILFTISGKTTTGIVFTVTKTQTFAKVKSATDSTIYRIVMSTKAVYKNSPNNTTAGPFNEIKGGAKKYVGNTVTNFGYLGVTPYIGNIPSTEGRAFVGGGDGIIFSPDPTDQSTKFVIRLYETDTSTTVLDQEEIFVIFKGDVGLNNALVYAYKRSASTVTDNPGAVTYSFIDKAITTASLSNGWSKTIPTGTDPLYVTVASASSSTSTDNIAANEWSAPVVQTKNGINTATFYLYRRNNSTTVAPSLRTGGQSTYTFSTAVLSGFDSNWSDAIPDSSNGSTIWVIQATAASDGATDTILDSEWSAPRVLALKGDQGVQGPVGASGANGTPGRSFVKVYRLHTSAASPPGAPSGNTLPPANWSLTPLTPDTTNFAQWESDGTSTDGASTWTWTTPYLSYFKVNTLSAIVVDTGSLNVSGNITAGSSPAISGTTMSGTGAIIYSDGKFGFGNSTNNIVWNNSSLTIRGSILSTNSFGEVLTGANTFIGTALQIIANSTAAFGLNVGGAANTFAITGNTTSNGGVGVRGVSNSTSTGYGVSGSSMGGVNSVGVYGFTNPGTSGVGVDAYSDVYVALRTMAVGTATALYVGGSMAITSTNLVTNLNADMVDGRHVGSGSNQIPINNDVINPGLVAGYLGFGSNKYYFSGTAATGSATANFAGTTKPGSISTNQWLLININGTNYYVPIWPA